MKARFCGLPTFIVITFLLSSCSFGLGNTDEAPTPRLTNLVGTVEITTTQPTEITLVDTPSIDQTATPTESVYADLEIDCLQILPSLPDIANLDGTLFLDVRVGSTSPPMLLDMKNGEKVLLPELESDGLYHKLSLDSISLAYKSFRTGVTKTVIMTADGQEREVADWQENWQTISYWFDNENIAIALREPRIFDAAPPTIILNTATGNYKELTGEFPNILGTAYRDFLWSTSTMYDPTVSRVAYIALGEESLELVLWDLREEKMVGRVSPWSGTFDRPKWSPDGQTLLMINEIFGWENGRKNFSEFHIMDYNGNVSRITQLTHHYEQSRIGNFEWSPDGRYVAFWFLNKVSDDFETLAVLDMERNWVTNYCVPGNQYSRGTFPPIWSPSSQQIVVGNISEDLTQSRIILVDVKHEFAAVLPENLTPIAWLAGSP